MVIALGIDIGSTEVKAAVVSLADDAALPLRELAVRSAPVAGLDAGTLVAVALDAARQALDAASGSGGSPRAASGSPRAASGSPRAPGGVQADVIGISSMAETGALVDRDGIPVGALLRWDRASDPRRREAFAARLDAGALHARTGAPLAAKLPLLTWAELAADGLGGDVGWSFTADLVATALTGRRATDHTLAGRSGAYDVPPPPHPLSATWASELLGAFGIPAGFAPRVLAPDEPVGAVTAEGRSLLDGHVRAGAPVYLAGHDHAVAAWISGARAPGGRVRSIGTTEAVVEVAPSAVDRAAAGRDGLSVVRTVDGVHEAVLAGSPAAGRLVAEWRARVVADGNDPAALEEIVAAASTATAAPHPDALALPYPRGRQCPRPDPEATLHLAGIDPGDRVAELHALLRGIAAHGGWMLDTADALCAAPHAAALAHAAGAGPAVPGPALVGGPYRRNAVLAGLAALVAGRPLSLIDLAAPVASGAAALAAVRAGLTPAPRTSGTPEAPATPGTPGAPATPLAPVAPVRTVAPTTAAPADLAARFRQALTSAAVA